MAVGTFKQACPSCEAQVPIRDEKLIGKMMECPKCKDKFLVKKPAKQADDEDEEVAPPPKPKKSKAAAAPVKKGKFRDDDDEDGEDDSGDDSGASEDVAEMDVEELDDAELEKLIQKKVRKTETETKEKKKFSKFQFALALAVIGLVVLAAAAYFILSGRNTPPNKSGPFVKKNVGGVPVEENPEDKKEPSKVKKDPVTKPVVSTGPLASAGAEVTNLLPGDSEYVLHVFFKEWFDPFSPFRDAVFQTPGALQEKTLKEQLGFNLLAVDDLIRADNYQGEGWSFTVLHLTEAIDLDVLTKTLGLQKVDPPVKKYDYYQVTASNPWFDTLARTTVGVPMSIRHLWKAKGPRTSYVHLHNAQTLIVADQTPLVAFLQAGKQPSYKGPRTIEKPAPEKKEPDATKVPGGQAGVDGKETFISFQEPFAFSRSETYMTINPALKHILDRMETRRPDSKDKILFSSATDLDAARLESGPKGWKPRPLWDVAQMLHDRPVRVARLGTGLLQTDTRVFQLRQELTAPQEGDAKALHKELTERTALDMIRFLDKFLGHKVVAPAVEMAEPKKDPMAPMVDPAQPKVGEEPVEKKEGPTTSRITVARNEAVVEFQLDLVFDQLDYSKLHGLSGLAAISLNAQMQAAAGILGPPYLGRAVKDLPVKGLSERNVLPGQYPPGAFPLPATGSRLARLPGQRVSWMAGLLPYLNQQALYGRVMPDQPWKHPVNWAAASTSVGEFLDPSYPVSSYFTSRPYLPVDLAATHFVGIAGVGLDAADYPHDDPAYLNKRGILSYERGAGLDEVKEGRGASNAVLMMQVPHDSLAGVTPWIAGGGSTLRGVPEKNSIAPFLLSSDKNGKPITHGNKRGSFALMADGSVRFIDQNISDEVFQAMCTVKGPAPGNFAEKLNEWAPAVPAGKAPAPKTTPKVEPMKTEPEKAESKKIEPGKKDAPKTNEGMP